VLTDDRILLGRAITQGIEPPKELVPDILLAGKVHSIYSGPGTGKTFLMLWIILRVIEQGFAVLLYDMENGPRIMAERLEQLRAEPAALDQHLHYHYYPDLRTTEKGRSSFEAKLDEVQPALVVFDSWINFLAANGQDENSSNDIANWAAHYTHPARSREIAVLILDHVPKDGVSARGSGRKKDEVDVMWVLKKPSPFDRENVGRIIIHREKDREGWLPLNVGFLVGGSKTGFVFERSSGTTEAEDEDGLKPSERKVLKALEDLGEGGAKASEWQKFATEWKVAYRTFYGAKKSLLEKGFVLQEKEHFFVAGAKRCNGGATHQTAPDEEEVQEVQQLYRAAPSAPSLLFGEPEDGGVEDNGRKLGSV
jgi:AAA domain